MIQTKFDLLQKVYFFNATEEKIQEETVTGINIVPTASHHNEEGVEVLDKFVILYKTKVGFNLAENEAFATREECKAKYAELFASI